MLKNLLLVEDDPDDVALFTEALREISPSMTCRYCPNGAQMIKRMNDFRDTDLIFLDINIPQVDGWECLHYLKKSDSFKHIPVILYSTTSTPADGRRAVHMGAVGFYEKPSSFVDFREFLKRLTLAGRNLLEALREIKMDHRHKIFL